MSTIPLLETIKQLAREEVGSTRPVNVLFGTVTKDSPLEITLDQHGVLTQEFLILSREVTEHEIEMTVDHITEEPDNPQTAKMSGGGGDSSFIAHVHTHKHKHPYKGRKVFLVHKGLVVGERVILISVQGGQKYLILDRVGQE